MARGKQLKAESLRNIKNFTVYEPNPEQRAADLATTGKRYRYLVSEDGLDWYDCQQLFSDQTVKVMYDANNVVRAVVAEPVPQRGNVYAVSMFFPLNMSVAEIGGTIPEGFELNTGSWLFDGQVVYQDAALLATYTLWQNQKGLSARLSKAAGFAFAIQSSAAVGNPRDGDSNHLLKLQEYADELRDVDLTATEPVWPAIPSFIQ
jgi:hypothetical protein